MNSGVYKIKNLVSGKLYVGSAVDITSRFKVHRSALNFDRHHNDYLKKSWDKYGEDSFVFEVIEYCSKDKLLEREQYWIDFYGATNRDIGYNILEHAGSLLGFKHTEETKRKISQSLKGEMVGEKNPMYGTKWTEEKRKEASEKFKGKNNPRYGNHSPLSEETKKKISNAVKGEKNPMYGTHLKHTQETRRKMSESRVGNKNPSYHTGRLITYEGKTLSIRGWAKVYDLTPSAIYHRLNRGWDEIRAITLPLKKRRSRDNK